MDEYGSIIETVESFFKCGKSKEFSHLQEIQLNDSRFSCFNDIPPYDLKDYLTTIALEELRFASISDYDYKISSPKISTYGDFAVVAFVLEQSGMLVDNKAFTGKYITMSSRATFVLTKNESWKIIHIHLSEIKTNNY